MIGIDTNVLVRFLVQDDPAQARAATRLFASLTETRPAYLPREVVLETVWVLERAYKFSRADISKAIDGLLEAREVVLEAADQIGRAVDRYVKGGPGFADHLIMVIAHSAGCETVFTFDKRAATQPDATLLT